MRWLPLLLFLAACPPSGLPEPLLGAHVAGRVRDVVGQDVAGVVLTLGDQTAVTGPEGYFSFPDPPEAFEEPLHLERADHTPLIAEASAVPGDLTWLELEIVPLHRRQNFPNTAGGTLETDFGGYVRFPERFAAAPGGGAYDGDVLVGATSVEPSQAPGNRTIPARLFGERSDGSTAYLQAVAYLSVELTDPMFEPLALAPDAELQFRVSVSDPLLELGGESTPVFTLDAERARWVESGEAQRSGRFFDARVSGNPIWLLAEPYSPAYIEGVVTDCSTGEPVPHATVTADEALGWAWRVPSTDEDGRFVLPAPPGLQARLLARRITATSEPVQATAGEAGSTVQVDGVCLHPPPVTLLLTWGEAPRDLDAHLSVPGQPREHVFFGPRRAGGAQLLNESSDGFGPEIIDVGELRDGLYRHSVHHFDGAGTLGESGARVRAVVPGEGLFEATVPPGGEGVDDVWTAWEFEAQDGRLRSLVAGEQLLRRRGGDDSVFHPED